MHTILLVNKCPSMLGCSSLFPSETAFLIHSLFQLQKYMLSRRRMTNATSQFFFFFLLVGCIKDSEQYFFFFSKKRTELEVRYTLYCVHVHNRCVSSVLFQLFFHITHEGIHDQRPLAVATNINSARALFLAAEGNACFFFFHLISRSHFSHPNFTNCKLQNTRMLTDTDHSRVRCSPIDSVKKTRDPK